MARDREVEVPLDDETVGGRRLEVACLDREARLLKLHAQNLAVAVARLITARCDVGDDEAKLQGFAVALESAACVPAPAEFGQKRLGACGIGPVDGEVLRRHRMVGRKESRRSPDGMSAQRLRDEFVDIDRKRDRLTHALVGKERRAVVDEKLLHPAARFGDDRAAGFFGLGAHFGLDDRKIGFTRRERGKRLFGLHVEEAIGRGTARPPDVVRLVEVGALHLGKGLEAEGARAREGCGFDECLRILDRLPDVLRNDGHRARHDVGERRERLLHFDNECLRIGRGGVRHESELRPTVWMLLHVADREGAVIRRERMAVVPLDALADPEGVGERLLIP